MRILHITESYDAAAGGILEAPIRLATAQAGHGHTVHFGARGTAEIFDRFTANFRHTPFIDSISLHRFEPGQTWKFLLPFHGPHRIPIAIDELRRFDILHLHGVWNPLNVAISKAAVRARIPYVVTPHAMLDPWSLRQRWLKKKIAFATFYKRVLNRANALHWLNKSEKKQAAVLGLTAKHVIIPNGIFLSEIDSASTTAIATETADKLPAKTPYLLFLGRLHHGKGLDLLAHAFSEIARQHPEVRLVVAGPDQGAQADFQRIIDRAGIQQRVQLTGPLSGAEKWRVLANAAAFCLPSRQEGFSVAILEAMACRVPVVISPECNFPEVADAGAGRVVENDPAAIAAAIAAILADPEAAHTMASRARQLIEQRYTWDKVAAAMLDIYRESLADGGGKGESR